MTNKEIEQELQNITYLVEYLIREKNKRFVYKKIGISQLTLKTRIETHDWRLREALIIKDLHEKVKQTNYIYNDREI